MNIFDIARETGYSIATVSRCINNSGYVSEKARKKIMKVIEENDYSVNAFAKGMATSSMSLAGIVSTVSRDQFQAECIYHLQKVLRENGYTALLSCSGLQLKDKQEALNSLLSRKVDAVFLIGSQFIEPSARENRYLFEASKKAPVFILNGALEHDNIYSLRCDDCRGMNELSELVLNAGSENPLMLVRRKTFSSRKKIEGFEQACRNSGIDPENRIIEAKIEDGVFPDLEPVLAGLDFDALICSDDELAVAALKFCRNHKIQVPETCQITGYNNSSLCLIPALEITTFDNRIEYLCDSAVFAMKQILNQKSYPSDSVYTGQLVEHDTTAARKEE